MSKIHCFTSATFSYLDRVRVLGETLRRHHPDWTLWLVLSDQEPVGFCYNPAEEDFDHVVRLSELDIPDLPRWLFCHDLVELCTAVKGQMLCRLLDMGAEKVIYLDPDIAVFESLSPLEKLLDTNDVLLTPHQVEPDDDEAIISDNEIGSLKYGIYNLGFLAVANRPSGQRFARWWRDRLLKFCFDDVPNGLFTDQRWCDHVPVFFDNVHIIRDPGYNVASWNLSRRPITIEDDGSILVAGSCLRFFHFTKVTWIGEVMLERYASGRAEVFELLTWYRKRLEAHGVAGLPKNWWAYGTYTNGSRIAAQDRHAYRHRGDLRERYPNPFLAGSEAFG